MYQFIVTGHGTSTAPDFSLDDIAGGVGRLDVLCRYVNSAFSLSYDIREGVRAHLILGDKYTVHFEGSELRRLNPGECSTVALIRKALGKREGAIGHVSIESLPGVSIRRMDFETTLEGVASDATVVELHEGGDPVVQVEPSENPFFVLSDHRGFTSEETKLLAITTDERVRLGPEILHADHSIIVAYSYLNTAGCSRYWVRAGGMP